MFQAAVIVVLLAAVAGCDLYVVQILRRFEVSRHWLSLTGVMRDFRVQRNGRDPQKAKYVVDCGYRFTVNGATFAATNRMPEKFPNAFDADKWVAALRAKGVF